MACAQKTCFELKTVQKIKKEEFLDRFLEKKGLYTGNKLIIK